jgi:hypothetical protein
MYCSKSAKMSSEKENREIISLHSKLGCALTFASEAKIEFEAKISFHLEAKKKPDFT